MTAPVHVPPSQRQHLTPRQQLLVAMAQAASVGNLDPFADELLKLRAQQVEAHTTREVLRYLLQQAKASDLPPTNGAILAAERLLAEAAAGEDGITATVRAIVREFREHQARRYADEAIPHQVTIPGTNRLVDNQVGVRVQLLTALADRFDPPGMKEALS